MDVGSGNTYPANALSNFSPHPFVIDGVECNSMEGFLQGLKFKSVEMQQHVCTLVGFAAKKKGSDKNWYVTQTLFWKGEEIKRDSKAYQDLLDRAYEAMYKNTKFKAALEASGQANLTHNIGKTDSSKTVLTRNEFCSRLMKLRNFGSLENNKRNEAKKLF